MRRIPPELCAKCKGYKRLCGLPRCPILDSFQSQLRASLSVKGREASGSTPPGVLIGESGYPRVNLYYMVPPGIIGEKAREYEDPVGWASRRITLSSIIRLRSSLLSVKLRVNAYDPITLYTREISPALISEKPIQTEAILAKPPIPRLSFSGISKPVGPTAPAERIRVAENPKPPSKIESLVWDDAPAAEAVWEAYRSGVDIYEIQRAFMLGLLGTIRRRRLVPTRWAITAVDEIVSSRLLKHIRGMREISEYMVYFGEYLGNRFTIVLLPGYGRIEWIEVWRPNTLWTRRASQPVIYYLFEDPRGVKSSEDGGYSAAKISVLEYMYKNNIRSDVLIIREILPSYYAPVGNWHIRETVKRALEAGPLLRSSVRDEALAKVRDLLVSDPEELIGRSQLVGNRRRTSLTDFFNI